MVDLAVGFAAVPDVEDDDEELLVVDLVDNSVARESEFQIAFEFACEWFA